MITPAAILGCIGRVHSNIPSTSFFRFVGELPEKFRPRCIMNALRQTMIRHHPVHRQIFDTNHTETVYDLAAFLMGEGIAPEGDTFMDSGDYPAVLPTLRCALRQFRVFALDLGKCLLFLAKKARVSYLFFITESSKGLETDINTHLGRRWLKTFRLTLAREGNIPFAGTTTADSAGFQFALERSMVDHLDRANLGESHTLIMGGRPGDGDKTETTLSKGEGVVAVSATETVE